MKRLPLLLFPLCLASNLFGQFSDPMVINSGFNQLENTVAFDIGGDEFIDLIALVDDEIRWLAPFEDQPDRFVLKQSLPAGPIFHKPIWFDDLDQDGDQDILTIVQELGTYWLAWYTYEGAGFFQNYQLIEALPGLPTTWARGNLDSDEVKEYAFLIEGSIYYFNLQSFSGNPVFASAPIDIGFDVDYFGLGDINGDGKDDLVASFGVVLVWYPNITNFSIAFDSEIIIGSDIIGIKMLAFGDIDGDLDMDIAAIPSNLNKAIWFKNGDGQGQVFSNPKNLLKPFDDGLQVFLSDLDHDGDLDGLGTRQDLGLFWAENLDGEGQFANPVSIQTLGEDNLNFSLIQDIKDINKDDYPDLLLRYEAADSISVGWLQNEFEQTAFFEYLPPVMSNSRFVLSMDAGDYDQDGDMDFVAISGRSGSFNQDKITLYETINGTSIYQFDLTTSIEAPNVNGQPTYQPFIRFEDVDQDGDLDILSFINWKLAVLENLDGLGDFAPIETLFEFPTEAGYAVTPTQLNDDQLIDLIGRTDVLLNQPNLINFSGLSTGFANNIERTQPIDFDDDGDTDILLLRSTSTEDLFFLAENLNGQGSSWDLSPLDFFEPDILEWQDFFPIDYDQDGDDDLIYINHNPLDHLVLQEQISPGVFSNTTQLISPIPLVPGINDLSADNFFIQDINGDDWEDFVFTDDISNSIFTLFRNPGINFLSELFPIASGLDYAYRIAGFQDVTGSGRPDFLLSADEPKGQLAWIQNFLGTSAADIGQLRVFTYIDNDANGQYQPTIDDPLPDKESSYNLMMLPLLVQLVAKVIYQ